MKRDLNLNTSRLLLRRWRESDRKPFSIMNSDPKVMEHFPKLLNEFESNLMVDRIEDHFNKNGFGLLAIEILESKEFIGFVGIQNVPFESHFTPAVEIGWRIASQYWGKGYAPEAARAVLSWAFENLNIDSVVALTIPRNIKSRRVMEKLGMIYRSQDDFNHPKLEEGNPLRHHVLYRTNKDQWRAK